MAKRKSPKRVAAARKAARTRARNRRAAAGGGHRRKRSSAKFRRRTRGLVRRANRTGKFVSRGGRVRGRKVRGGYHKAGRILKENYSLENPLDGSELVVGLITGVLGFVAADMADRFLAIGSKTPTGATAIATSAPIYSDYMRLGAGVGLTAVPLIGAHFVNGAKHKNTRTALQLFGLGAGIRTLGHVVSDLIAYALKSNSTVASLYGTEILAQGATTGGNKVGAGALPEEAMAMGVGMGAIPEGLAACCNNTSRLLNGALSPLQPIGRSPGEQVVPPALPPPIERMVFDSGGGGTRTVVDGGGNRIFTPGNYPPSYTPVPTTTSRTGGGNPTAERVTTITSPVTPPAAAPPAAQFPGTVTTTIVGAAPGAPGVAGFPTPFAWGNDSRD